MKWYKHIKWFGYWETKHFDINGTGIIPKTFNFCPICGAKRPPSNRPTKRKEK